MVELAEDKKTKKAESGTGIFRYRKLYQERLKHHAVSADGDVPTEPRPYWHALDGLSRGMTLYRDGEAETYYIRSGERTDLNTATRAGFTNVDVVKALTESPANGVQFVLEEVSAKDIADEEAMQRAARATKTIAPPPGATTIPRTSPYNVPGSATVSGMVV